MIVREAMREPSPVISLGTTMQDAAELFAACHQSDIPVVDGDGRYVGLLAEGDLLRATMPDLDEIVSEGGRLVQAYEMFLANGADLAGQPIDRVMLREPVMLRSGDELLKAATVMVNRHIRLLVVVDDGELVGVLSRADVCRALLADAQRTPAAQADAAS